MTQQIVNIGSAANDGTGDPLRTAFNKINTNFTELYAKGAAGSNLDLSENEIAATNSNGNVELVPNGSGRVVIVDDHVIIATSRSNSAVGQAGDVAGMLSWDDTNIYICTANFDGSTTIWNTLATTGATDLILSGDTSNSLTSTSNSNINITPNGTGSTVIKNITTANVITSSLATGTAPFIVSSTTQVANLNVATAGTVTTAAQPNITSVGTLTSLTTSGQITSTLATGTAPFIVSSTTQVANLNVATAGTVTTAAQPNITSVGTLTIASVDNLQLDGNTISTTNTNGDIILTPNGTGVILADAAITAPRFISNVASGTAPFVVSSTTQVANLNVATAGTVTTAAQPNITSTGTLTSLIIAAGTTSIAPVSLTAGTNLTTAAAGAIEYDGSHLYATPETTSGRAKLITKNTFRLLTNGSAIGPAIADYFGASSAINLAASSVYTIVYHAYMLKTTAGTATWTLTASSAPTLISANYIASPITGIAAGATITGYAGSQAATTAVFPVTGSLTTAVNHSFLFTVQVITNAATTFKLQLTQSAGTATPLAGSYYTVERISGSVGSFA